MTMRWSWIFLGVVGCSGAEDSNIFADAPKDAGSNNPDATVQDASSKDAAGDRMDMKDVRPDMGPMKSYVSCGMNMCGVPEQLCCRGGQFMPYSYTCQSPGDPCVGLQIPCDKAANCDALGFPGQVCCAHYIPFGGNGTIADSVSCKPSNQCTQMQSSIILCDPKDQNPCPNGGQCVLSQGTIPGYYFCKG